MECQSSGSNRAAISVEPTRSQKRTVSCRRSPTAPSPPGGGAPCTPVTGGTTCAPHWSQNFAVGRSTAEQLAHTRFSGAAHASQNLAVARFSCRQVSQRTVPPAEPEPFYRRSRRSVNELRQPRGSGGGGFEARAIRPMLGAGRFAPGRRSRHITAELELLDAARAERGHPS